MIEAMCNEILGNYTKKEDQLMTAPSAPDQNEG
jgi:heat shock protein HslJ